jgi:hypothetical protein
MLFFTQNEIMASLVDALDYAGFSVEAVYPDDEADVGQYIVEVKYIGREPTPRTVDQKPLASEVVTLPDPPSAPE